MEKDVIKRRLEIAGLSINEEKRLGNNTGTQIKLTDGSILNIFDSGKVTTQGKHAKELERVLGLEKKILKAGPKAATERHKKVFVVYGHDTNARNELEATLRRWGLEPIILDQLPSEGATLIEKLENYYKEVGFAVVLATPDDQGFRKEHPEEAAYRARQNVVLELGMLLAFLGRKKVAVLLKDQESMERPSDIQGLIYIPFKNDIAKDAGLLLAKEMDAQGYEIDVGKI